MRKVWILSIFSIIIIASNTTILSAQSWEKLMDSTMLFYQNNQIDRAIPYGVKALESAESQLGKLDSNVADIASLLTYLHWSTQQFETALKYARLDSSVRIQTQGKQNPAYINSIMNIGAQYAGMKNNKAAEMYFIEAIEVAKIYYQDDQSKVAELMGVLATFYQSNGETAKADSLNREAGEMYREGQSWMIYMDSCVAYQMQNDFQKAIKWGEIAIDTAKVQLGLLDSNVADIAARLTYFYWRMENFDKALEYARLDSSIRVQTIGKDNDKYIVTLLNIGAQYMGMQKTELAVAYNEELVEIARKIHPDDHQMKVTAISNLAQMFIMVGEFAKAEPLILEVLEMSKRMYAGDDIDLSNVFLGTAAFYYQKGDLKKAEAYYIESAEMKKRVIGGDAPVLAETLDYIAGFYDKMGDFDRAETYYIEVVEMNRRLYPTDNIELLTTLQKFANFYQRNGLFRNAEPLYLEAENMAKRMFNGDHPRYATTLFNLGLYYSLKGDLKKAEELLLESLAMSRRLYKYDHTVLNQNINGVAYFYDLKKDSQKAEPYFIEGLEMARRLYKFDCTDLAGSIHNMAFYYNSQQKYDAAEKLYLESLGMLRRVTKKDDPDLANSLANIANLYFNKQNYVEAEKYFLESLEMIKRLYTNNNIKFAGAYQVLGNFYRSTDKGALAEKNFKISLDSYINVLNYYFQAMTSNEKKNFWNSISEVFELFNSFAVERSADNAQVLSRMYDLQLYSKALLFNSSGKVKNRILNSKDTVLINKYNDLTAKKELLTRVYAMTEETRIKNGYNIDSLESEATRQEKTISLMSENYKQSYEQKTITWRTIQAVLKPDEAAVEVVRYRTWDKGKFTDSVQYAFLIINDACDENPEVIVINDGNKLENEFYNEYRAKIGKKVRDTSSFGRYWEPLFNKLKKYKKIYFSADGIYNKLNPATLLAPDGKYLLELQDVQQINSSRDILLGFYQMKEESNVYNTAVLIGNPNFSLAENNVRQIADQIRSKGSANESEFLLADTRGVALTNLPGTEKEINNIEKFLKGKNWNVKTFLSDQAVKASVKTVQSPRILHIATHGLFLEDVEHGGQKMFGFAKEKMIDNPLLRSGLFFTGADNFLRTDTIEKTDDENGILTAYEAMNLDLDKTELVVLSACETGLGEVQNGEGVFGLRRAFQQAGARTVLMSLWKVNDEATQDLMSQFYSYWVSGMTKREAFSKSQIDIKAKYRDPYYWGAFVMVGE